MNPTDSVLGATRRPNGGSSSAYEPFPTTNWQDIEKILHADPLKAHKAFSDWIDRYRGPLVSFYLTKGHQRSDADDLAQGLIAKLIEQESLRKIEFESSLRSWLLKMAENHRIDVMRHERAAKRCPPGGTKPLGDDEPIADRTALNDPAEAFHASWRRTVLERVYGAVREECLRRGRADDLELFMRYYVDPLLPARGAEPTAQPTWEMVAREFGSATAKEASHRADWVKRKWQKQLRLEIRGYVRRDSEVDSELRDLLRGPKAPRR